MLEQPSEPKRRRRRWPWIAAALAVVVAGGITTAVLIAGGGSSDPGLDHLKALDPHGAQACAGLRDWLDGNVLDDKGQVENPVVIALALSNYAAAATTVDIRQTVGNPALDQQSLGLLQANGYGGGNMRFTNLAQLDAACAGLGVKMPLYTETPAKH